MGTYRCTETLDFGVISDKIGAIDSLLRHAQKYCPSVGLDIFQVLRRDHESVDIVQDCNDALYSIVTV
jgi:hypothetical protein